ncbi:monocarboxylate transporter 13-like isoform X2 [Oscarella lobularis]
MVIMIGSLLFGLGMSLTAAVTTSPWQGVLLYGVLGGVGGAFIYAPALSLIPLHFDKHLSLASGIAISACFLGPTVGSPISQAVVDRFDSGGLAILYGLLGLLSFGTAILIRPSLRATEATSEATPEATPEATNGALAMFTSAKENPRVIVWIFVMACEFFLLLITIVHMIRHAECSLQLDTTSSSLLLTYLNLSTALGSVITGLVGRRVKSPIYLQMSLMIISGSLAVFFPLYNSYVLLAIFSVLFGLTVSMAGLMPFVISFIMGARLAPHGVFLMTFVTGILAPLGPPLAGWMYDLFGNYQYSFVVTGLVVVLTATVEIGLEAVFQRKRNRREKETQDETIIETAFHDSIVNIRETSL